MNKKISTLPVAMVLLVTTLIGVISDATPSSAGTVTYSSSQTVTPPSSAFSGAGGGGDGWGVALSSTKIYNVFHHQVLAINCHLQSDASTCDGFDALAQQWQPVAGGYFYTSGEPAMYLDQATGYLYVFATRSDNTVPGQPGIACFDTNATPDPLSNTAGSCTGANGEPQPWTPLGGIGSSAGSPGTVFGNGPVNGVFYNGNFYAYNLSIPGFVYDYLTQSYSFLDGSVSPGGADWAYPTTGQNDLLCYNIAAQSPCQDEPYAINFGSSVGGSSEGSPGNAETLIGSKLFIPSSWDGNGGELSCVELSGATPTNCLGSVGASWPQATGGLDFIAPIPYLDSSGVAQGVCFESNQVWTCWGLDASPLPTPPNLNVNVIGNRGAIYPGSGNWLGSPVIIGTRVLLANNTNSDTVDCFDWATLATCTAPNSPTDSFVDGNSAPDPGNFPLHYGNGLSLIYTVNSDPARPTCVWVNADTGSSQIQNLDGITGGSCASAPVRVFASSFVAPYQACLPTSFTSISISLSGDMVTSPAPTLSFTNSNGVVIDGPYTLNVSDSQHATLDLTTLTYPTPISLSTISALPQFVLGLQPVNSGSLGDVTITASWSGKDLGQCSPTYAGPSPTTQSATSIADNSATLNGTVTNPGTDSVTPVGFCYQKTVFTSTNCTGTFVAASQSVASSATTPVSKALANLSSGTTYYYELVATDSTNNGLLLYGGVSQFSTGPLATTFPVTSVTEQSAALSGSLYNPASDTFSDVTFCYQTRSFASGTCAATPTTALSVGTQGTTTTYGLGLDSLEVSTTYYYELIATSDSGPIYGGVLSFTTGPTATTQPATAEGDSVATLNGRIFNPAPDTFSDVTFCYQTRSFASGTCAATPTTALSVGTQGTTTTYGADLTVLSPNTTYYYELVAVDTTSNTTLYGGVLSFATGPTAITAAATGVTTSTATLNGSLFNPAADSLTSTFCYQQISFTSGSCSGTTVSVTAGSPIASVSQMSATLSNLAVGAKYYFELISSGPDVTVYGGVQSFATTAIPVVTTAPCHPINVAASMNTGTATATFTPGCTGNLPNWYEIDMFVNGVSVGNVCNVSGFFQCSTSGIGPNVLIAFTVTAVNDIGRATSGLSNVVSYDLPAATTSTSTTTTTTTTVPPSQVVPQLNATCFFDTASSVLTSGDEDQIKKAAAQIAEYHYKTVYLNGYTDLRASVAYNIALSQSRNDAVESYLMTQLKTYNILSINVVKVAHGITKASPVLAEDRKVTITN